MLGHGRATRKDASMTSGTIEIKEFLSALSSELENITW